ncbi:MAG: transposase [Spirochaetia bacterium]
MRFHPHWHAIFLEGGFDHDGRFLHIPFGNLEKMAQAFRQRVLALFLDLGLLPRDRAESLLCWRRSGFSVDGSVGLYATDPAAMERLAQYMARPPISLSKVTLQEQGANVLFHAKYNPYFRQSLKLFAVTDFIAERTQHLPPKGVHHIRRYELYSSRTRSTWARLIAKIYGADPFTCPRCANSVRVLAIITDPSQVDRILRHLIKIGRAPPGFILAPLH